MTEYILPGDKKISEITDLVTRNQYLAQAKELYQKGEANNMTFLPVAEGYRDMLYPLVQSDYERKSREDTQAYSYIIQKSLEETFKRGNPQHDGDLIIGMSKDDVNDRYSANIDEWRALTLRAIREQMRKDSEWFGKLTPAAQLAAIGLEMHVISHGSTPSLQYEEGLKFDFGRTEEDTYSADLSQAANMILSKAYRRSNEHAYPLEDSRLTWEVKAAALEAQLKSHGRSWTEKIPSLPVFIDLLKTAEKPAQQLKLAELAKEPDFKESMRYDGFRNELRQSFKDIAPCGEATQKLFYEVLYNFGLRGINEPKLQLTDINFGTLQAAVAECKAQRSVDEVNNRVDLNYKEIAKLDKKLKTEGLSKQEKEFIEKQADDLRKKNVITGIPDIELVAKYRPQFLEQPAKMTPELCAHIMDKYGDKLSAQTQLEMMTKVVDDIAQGLSKGNGLNEQDYKVLGSCVKRATALNTSSKAMEKFLKTLQPVVEFAEKQYAEDKQYVADAKAAAKEYEAAAKDQKMFEKAREEYVDLLNKSSAVKNMRRANMKEPTDEAIDAFFADVKSGKAAKLEFKPKGGLGRMFMGKDAKSAEQEMQHKILELNAAAELFAKAPEFKYVGEIADNQEYYAKEKQKYRDTQDKLSIKNDFYLLDRKEKSISAYETLMEADKSFAALKEQFEKRSKEMQGRARTDLAMQFGEQQFEERSKEMQGRARKPLEGLVKEEKMAQDIYKAKIAELRQSIKDGVKQDMTDRGVNEKPNLDNPNEVGKPMTAEGTKKIRKNMKDLKQYKQLVKE